MILLPLKNPLQRLAIYPWRLMERQNFWSNSYKTVFKSKQSLFPGRKQVDPLSVFRLRWDVLKPADFVPRDEWADCGIFRRGRFVLKSFWLGKCAECWTCIQWMASYLWEWGNQRKYYILLPLERGWIILWRFTIFSHDEKSHRSDNAQNVVQAAKVLTNQEQFAMAQRKVTISTVGPSPEAFEVLGDAPTVLAWSVHASSDELRKELVPTTKYSMVELRRGYMNSLLKRNVKLRTTMLEIALIDGINDSIDDAEHLADFVQGMVDEVPGMKAMINLIPFNDIGFAKYRKPSVEQVWAYQERLTARGFKCFIRTTRGDDESAACGQLATSKKTKSAVPSQD